MARKPLAIKLDEDLIVEIDDAVSATEPRPSRIGMINHLLWLAIRILRNAEIPAERLYRMRHPDGGPWVDLPDNRKRVYLDLARQMIDDMCRA